jgi:cytochrome c oxidase subunit 2
MTRSRSTTLFALVTSCGGSQSALDPGGREASRVLDLFWIMTIGAAAIWLSVVALAVYATYFARAPLPPKLGRRLVIGGGVAFPVIALAVLLVYGLALLPEFLRPAPDGALKIQVTGHQWWWRVRYLREGAAPVDTANELHLPVGRTVEFQLDSADVIHSFWIPALGGKVDMIPGRSTRLVLEPTREGVYRGVCAEYCGTSHALMAFFAIVRAERDFERWLAEQAEPARSPERASGRRGGRVFLASGCGACHTVRGTRADGVVGPDLTHVGSRSQLGGGNLPAEPWAFRRFVAAPDEVKPGVHMPAFRMLPAEDLDSLAAYLEGLK